jgi:hypothetical protein
MNLVHGHRPRLLRFESPELEADMVENDPSPEVGLLSLHPQCENMSCENHEAEAAQGFAFKLQRRPEAEQADQVLPFVKLSLFIRVRGSDQLPYRSGVLEVTANMKSAHQSGSRKEKDVDITSLQDNLGDVNQEIDTHVIAPVWIMSTEPRNRLPRDHMDELIPEVIGERTIFLIRRESPRSFTVGSLPCRPWLGASSEMDFDGDTLGSLIELREITSLVSSGCLCAFAGRLILYIYQPRP